jgi:SAM-dependent methyltransferase
MHNETDFIGGIIDAVSRYMAEVGITECNHAKIDEVAQGIASLLGCLRRDYTFNADSAMRGSWSLERRKSPEATEESTQGAAAPSLAEWKDLPKGWLTPEEDALVPPRHLWIGPFDPISHYYRWTWEYLAYLTLLCGLCRESSVLELGCGHGRTARGLLDYLRGPGRYCGLDVDRVRIADAQIRLQSNYPHFQFIWTDVHNRQYNPKGDIPAASYVFPFKDDAFDVVYAASLFTHLLPDETANYFGESQRVLRPGGKCLFSMFLLDYYRGGGTTISPLYEFEHQFPNHPGVAVRDPLYPDALIAYSMAVVEDLAACAGLRVLRLIPGLWSESPGFAVHEQDLVLLCRDT